MENCIISYGQIIPNTSIGSSATGYLRTNFDSYIMEVGNATDNNEEVPAVPPLKKLFSMSP